MRKYTFQLTKEEVREFCLRAIWEQQRFHRVKWLFILGLLALECFLVPWVVPLAVIPFLLAIYALVVVLNYFMMKKKLCGKTRVLWAEDGMLKLDTEGESYREISCDRFTVIRVTSRLLMLGCYQAPKKLGWYPVPLRVFVDGQERDRFVEYVRNPQAWTGEESAEGAMREHGTYLHFSFQIGSEAWIRMMSEATEIIQAGTMGKQKKNRFVWPILAVVCILLPCWVIWRVPGSGWSTYIWLFIGVILFLSLLRVTKENPEKRIRMQIRKGMLQNDPYGEWEISVSDMGVRQSMAGKDNVEMPWESLFCMVETDTGLFFYQKDKRHFVMLPKKCMNSWEQIDAIRKMCVERQMAVLAGKRLKYAPNWLFPVLTVGVATAFLAVSLGSIIWDSQRDEYSNYVPLEEQVSVLRSFGFSVSEEMEQSLREDMEEYEIASYVENYPYTWVLLHLARTGYEEDWETGAGKDIFWFDFEGWDISTDYIMVLEGMQRLSSGSILDDVGNIREDTEKVNWERGTGTITVLLEWNGGEYSWRMNVQHDWIDEKVLGIYNGLLKRQKVPERFYVTDDGGQGAIVFYCTQEWALAFEDATGLDLEASTVKKGW